MTKKANKPKKRLTHAKLVKIKPEDLKKSQQTTKIDIKYPIYCIGQKYFLQQKDGTLYPTTIGILKRRHGAVVEEHIIDLLGYTNEPSHIDYKQVYNDLYNTYKKMCYEPLYGEWGTIKMLLQHVFQDQYTMGVEYFWNLYINPKQKLPFLGIVSEEKGTGKSTFLTFIQLMFKGNEAIVSGHDFKTNFNASFVSALVCTSDEHCEAGDRTKIAQTMKTLITESKTRVEPKGQDAYTMHCYGKFIFASNNVDKLTFIEGENTRYWIIQIPVLKEVVFDIMTKLENEIPAFLFYLKNVFNARPLRDRLYFLPSEFQTDASRNVQAHSKSVMYQQIEETLLNWFEDNPNKTEAYARPNDLAVLMNEHQKQATYIRRVLKNEFKLNTFERGRYTSVLGSDGNGTPFVFKREYFIEGVIDNPQDDILPF